MADTTVPEVFEDGYEVVYPDDEEETSNGSDVWDQDKCELRVLKDKCSTCIYGPNRFVNANTVRLMEEETRQDDSGHVQCHHTLPQVSGREDVGAICRGWWDRNAARSWLFRLAKRDGIVNFVEEPPTADGVKLQ